MAVKVWHTEHSKDDILVRLINDNCGWIDLRVVDKKGKDLYQIMHFETSDGGIYLNDDKAYIEDENYGKALIHQTIGKPYFKIWHNSHKAMYKLRLTNDGNCVACMVVDSKGTKRACGNLFFIHPSFKHNKIRIELAYGVLHQRSPLAPYGVIRVGILGKEGFEYAKTSTVAQNAW